MFLCDNKRNQNSWNTYEMQKDNTVMHYTRVNVKRLVRCTKYCIILLPFQLKTKRKNQHYCTSWLTKKRLKQNKKISGLYCGTMLGCSPESWYPSVLQAIVSTVWYSTALKFEIFPSVFMMSSHITFLFLAFSLPCGKCSGLICLIFWLYSPVSSYGHVGKFPPFMGLKPNMVVRLSSAI